MTIARECVCVVRRQSCDVGVYDTAAAQYKMEAADVLSVHDVCDVCGVLLGRSYIGSWGQLVL